MATDASTPIQPIADANTRTAVEAAVFRHLLAHLDQHPEVQNIDLMNLAGFCRNCLGKWYATAAADQGIDLDKETAREVVYGMPYADWKAAHQTPASPEQLATRSADQADAGALRAK